MRWYISFFSGPTRKHIHRSVTLMRTWMLALLSVPVVFSLNSTAAEFSSTWRVEFENVGDPAASYNAGTKTYTIGEGQQFRANVYVNSTQNFNGLDLTFGWGTATSMGNDATNLNTNFAMNEVTIDPNGLFDYHIIPSGSDAGLSGFRQLNDEIGTATGERPYGQYLSLYNNAGAIAAGTDVKIASFLMTNQLVDGSSGILTIWDANAGKNRTSQLVVSNFDFSRPGGSVNYNVKSIPEPSSLVAMGCAGVGVLANCLRLRRRR